MFDCELNVFVKKKFFAHGNFLFLEKTLPSRSSEERSVIVSGVSLRLAMSTKAFAGVSSPGDLHSAEQWIIDPFLY